MAIDSGAAAVTARRNRPRLLGSLLLAAPALVSATVIDFTEQQTRFEQTDNFVSQGLVFSAGCHYDLLDTVDEGSTQAKFGNWLGFDGNPDCALHNPDYLGPSSNDPPSQKLSVHRVGGGTFSLESFVFVSVASNVGAYTVTSSKGGSLAVSSAGGEFAEYDFSAPQWSDIEWLEFNGGGGGVPAGFDNLVVDLPAVLPEPPSLMLVAASLTFIGLLGRRTRR